MICKNCGKDNKGSARFCSGCGRPMESIPEKEGNSGRGEAEQTMNRQGNLDTSVGKAPVSMGWIAFSKFCMVVVLIVFSMAGFLLGAILTNSEDGAAVFGVIGFAIGLVCVLWQALITAICQNLYINVENTNLLINKVQALSEQIERQNENLEEQKK